MEEAFGRLCAAGHMTVEVARLEGAVTVSGYYRATNGFWYVASWRAGVPLVSSTGYSGAYLAAERAYRDAHGAWVTAEEYHAFIAFVLQRLGLAACEEESCLESATHTGISRASLIP